MIKKSSYAVREIKPEDKSEIFDMMAGFYASEAVSTNGSKEIFERDIDVCIQNSSYLRGFVFIVDNKIAGYAMISKSFSTEYARLCIWLEDLYLKPEYRGQGIAPDFIKDIKELYTGSIFKLEVETDNKHAVHVYEKSGFEKLPYTVMINF